MDEDGSSEARDQVTEFEVSLYCYVLMTISNNLNSLTCCDYLSMQEFYTHQGEWFHTFSEKMPGVVSRNMLELRNREFGITEVKTWVEQHGSMPGRFQFFETNTTANSEFYHKVTKPLLSMLTVGSIDVERRVKRIKGNTLTKKHNKLQDSKGYNFGYNKCVKCVHIA